MTGRPQIIIDCETTSLVPNYASRTGEIWELALIECDIAAERLWRMEPDVSRADQNALKVGRFHERTEGMRHATRKEVRARWPEKPGYATDVWDLAERENALTGFWSDPAQLASGVAAILRDATIIAANPAFDAGFLAAFLAHYGYRPTWHYRLRDIGSMAWAWLQAHHLPHHLDTPPMDAGTDEFARALGIDPDDFDRHTALGDCRLADAMLRVIRGGQA